MGGGGERGLLDRTIRLLTVTLKRLYLATPNLQTFLSIRHILAEFQQNRFASGVAAVVFGMRRPEKLNI